MEEEEKLKGSPVLHSEHHRQLSKPKWEMYKLSNRALGHSALQDSMYATFPTFSQYGKSRAKFRGEVKWSRPAQVVFQNQENPVQTLSLNSSLNIALSSTISI